ncbi:hypothetical protein F2Q70_00026977 [Brassica cretica]|uniref:Uncharacterized protein n=1 Tax=Brassica cretica TaxID=69181 RepID=A0A8S9L6B5_BRACR|nr:hypothetical protein F2Q70_00026977 [Brassica cretica]
MIDLRQTLELREKRVRFPKGRKYKPDQLLLKEAVALRQACAAVLERSYIRNQNTAELFIGHSDNIDDAEA